MGKRRFSGRLMLWQESAVYNQQAVPKRSADFPSVDPGPADMNLANLFQETNLKNSNPLLSSNFKISLSNFNCSRHFIIL